MLALIGWDEGVKEFGAPFASGHKPSLANRKTQARVGRLTQGNAEPVKRVEDLERAHVIDSAQGRLHLLGKHSAPIVVDVSPQQLVFAQAIDGDAIERNFAIVTGRII